MNAEMVDRERFVSTGTETTPCRTRRLSTCVILIQEIKRIPGFHHVNNAANNQLCCWCLKKPGERCRRL